MFYLLCLYYDNIKESTKSVCIELQENTEVVSITVTKKGHRLSQTLQCHNESLRKVSQIR